MEENEGQESHCFVRAGNEGPRIKLLLSDIDADNTVDYIKTLACSEWEIDLPGVYTLNMGEEIWHDYCIVPRNPVHEFCLVPHKGQGQIKYTKFKSDDPLPPPPELEPSRPHPSDLYFKLRKKLGECASLCPFEEIYATEETISITLYVEEKDAMEDVLRLFEPKPRQKTYTDTNKVVLFF